MKDLFKSAKIKGFYKNYKLLFAMLFCIVFMKSYSQQTEIKYLSGLDKDNTVEWDFFAQKG